MSGTRLNSTISSDFKDMAQKGCKLFCVDNPDDAKKGGICIYCKVNFNPIQDKHFWIGRGAKGPCFLKSVTHILP